MLHELYPQNLRHDPLAVFRESKTPAALYARQKWMRKKNTKEWQSDFRQVVDYLLSNQKKNGSWGDSLLVTVHRLFGLHLTIRNRTQQTERAIEWALSHDIMRQAKRAISRGSGLIHARDLSNLPFSRGCHDHVLTCSILFLASLFGYASDERVMIAYDILSGLNTGNKEKWCDWSCSNNFLRACIVHPVYRDSKTVKLFVAALKKVQNNDGGWPAPIPFYQTVNALAHLDTNQSDDLLAQAFLKLRRTQNRDGTWGRSQVEWNTFLIVHAIKRKGFLLQTLQGEP